MEAVIFAGIQASGKSTFYFERFLDTHVRINLDTLKTRNRERGLLLACLEAGRSFVVDNTNPTPEERQRYIVPAKERGYRIVGYYFRSSLAESIHRNATREVGQRIPVGGIHRTHARLKLPSFGEGFDALYYVRVAASGGFVVEEWMDEVR